MPKTTSKRTSPTISNQITLTDRQRKYLKGQIIICSIGAFFAGITAWIVLAIFLKQSSQSGNFLLLITLIPILFCGLLIFFGFQFWNDLNLGYTLRKSDQLTDIIKRPGRVSVRTFVFSTIGTLQLPPREFHSVSIDDSDIGKTFAVIYSPSSKIVWALAK